MLHPIPQSARRRDKTRPRPPLRPYPPPSGGRLPGDAPPPHGVWEIIIAGELTDKQGDLHDRLMEVPPKSRGTIFFDSCGGNAFIGLALASLIRLRGLKAIGVVAGECSSAALMPLAACAERYVIPQATLLFHPIRWSSEEHVRLEEASEWARHFLVMEADHDKLLAQLFGCESQLISRWNRPGKFVTGVEFAASGLAKLVDLFADDVWTQIARWRQMRLANAELSTPNAVP
jgi:ATP-dependent Clp protease protease subunit